MHGQNPELNQQLADLIFPPAKLPRHEPRHRIDVHHVAPKHIEGRGVPSPDSTEPDAEEEWSDTSEAIVRTPAHAESSVDLGHVD